MSDVQRLKSQLEQIGSEAKTTAGNLSSFKQKFSQASGEVQSAIGGTATGTDKQILETLQAAQKQVDAAVAALEGAASAASSYARSI
jgi:uncharacterized protein YjbJ (UPF0337 family)